MRRTLLLIPFLSAVAAAGTIVTVVGTGKPALDLFEGDGTAVNIDNPFGVEVGPDGALYVCEVGHHRVLRQDRTTGKVTTVAGAGKKGLAGDGGPATKALLDEPYEVRFDRAGNILFVEMKNAVIRKVDAKTGVISTVAGTGKHGFAGDGGPAVKAEFRQPHSIALDADDNLYIADIGNHRIRKVDAKTGVIETIAGNGERKLPVDGDTAAGKPMVGPRALFVSGSTLWIALREGHSVWKLDLKSGKLAHVAGTGKVGFADGPGKTATFNGPKGIAVDAAGNAYVADTENHAIRKIDKTGAVSTIAGSGPKNRGYAGDGGPATAAKMNRPHGVCVDDKGVVYIGDSETHRVRRVTAD